MTREGGAIVFPLPLACNMCTEPGISRASGKPAPMVPGKPHRCLTASRLRVVNHCRAESQKLTERFQKCCLAVPSLEPADTCDEAEALLEQAGPPRQGLMPMQTLQANAASQPLPLEQVEPLGRSLLRQCSREGLLQLKSSMTPCLLHQMQVAVPAGMSSNTLERFRSFATPCMLEVPMLPGCRGAMSAQVSA